jgi:general secretion pathway protein A
MLRVGETSGPTLHSSSGDRGRPGGYLGYYELREPPFSSTPDPRFIFPSRSLSFASTRILQALQRREGLIVITGRSGTGKSALSRYVLRHLTGPGLLCVIADPFLTADELLRHLLGDFGVTSDQKLDDLSPSRTSCHDLVVMLQRFLTTDAPSDATAAIVIDDAQHLQRRVLEQLRALSNLESDAGKLLQIMLIGEPELEALLRKPEAYNLHQRVACRIRLEPLSTAEVGRYIEHHLAAARAGEKSPDRLRFTAPAVRMLARISRGAPRALNALCDRALEIGFERRAEHLTRRVVIASAGQLKVPVPMIARYPLARELAAALVAIAIVTIPLLMLGGRLESRLGRSMRGPALQRASERESDATPPPSTAAPVAAKQTLEPIAVAGALEAADSYLVVVASFRNPHNADAIATQLEQAGFPAFAREDAAAGWHVVVVGPYASQDEAHEAQKQVAFRNFSDSRIRVQRR